MAAKGTPAVVLEAFSQLNFNAIFETEFSLFLGPFGSHKWRQNRSTTIINRRNFGACFWMGFALLWGAFSGLDQAQEVPRGAQESHPELRGEKMSKAQNKQTVATSWPSGCSRRPSEVQDAVQTGPTDLQDCEKTRSRKKQSFNIFLLILREI